MNEQGPEEHRIHRTSTTKVWRVGAVHSRKDRHIIPTDHFPPLAAQPANAHKREQGTRHPGLTKQGKTLKGTADSYLQMTFQIGWRFIIPL